MDIITWIGLLVMIFAVAAGWAQIAEIVARHRRGAGMGRGRPSGAKQTFDPVEVS